MAKPGIMFYFENLEPIKVLPDADAGKLFKAMMEYGKDGVVPEFTGMLAMAWGFIKPQLDRDDEAYEKSKSQRKYAAFCKQRSALKLPKIPFEEWAEMSCNERERMLTADNGPLRAVDSVESRYPSTSTASSTSTAAVAVAESDAFAAATAAEEKRLRIIRGELGRGVVALTGEQVDVLLERIGVDAFDYYVEKLATFIIEKGAHVKNHFATIMKWWAEDSTT